MRKLKFRLDRKSLEVTYTSFIRPILEYGDVVLDNCSQYEKQEIEKVQIEAARIVTGTTKLISLNLLYIEAGWDSLEKRRKYHKLTLFYKLINNISPSYLSDLVPQSVNSISHYNLRNADDLESVASRTNQYYNSFLPSVVREWNELTNDVRQSDSLRSFKCNINRERTTVPKHFYSGTRKTQILHTRLRTNCSSLNNDLYSKNLTDSPLCRCGSVENTNHFIPSVYVL